LDLISFALATLALSLPCYPLNHASQLRIVATPSLLPLGFTSCFGFLPRGWFFHRLSFQVRPDFINFASRIISLWGILPNLTPYLSSYLHWAFPQIATFFLFALLILYYIYLYLFLYFILIIKRYTARNLVALTLLFYFYFFTRCDPSNPGVGCG